MELVYLHRTIIVDFCKILWNTEPNWNKKCSIPTWILLQTFRKENKL